MNDGTNELVAEVEARARELELKLQLIVCTVTFTAKEIKRLTTTNSNKSKRYAVCDRKHKNHHLVARPTTSQGRCHSSHSVEIGHSFWDFSWLGIGI